MTNARRTRKFSLALPLMAALSGGLVAALAAGPGCTAAPCTTPNPNVATTSLECPAGDLCYLGECVRSCNAGQERVLECTTDNECGDSRPNCIDGFCSSCEGSETCVPSLNVCKDVLPAEYPDPAMDDPFMERPPFPLDGGAEELDGGVFQFPGIQRIRDAGITGPVVQPEITVSGFWDVYEEIDLRGAGASLTSSSSLHVYDVAGVDRGLDWRSDLRPPRISAPVDTDTQIDGCTIRSFTTSATVTGRREVSLGNLTIDDLDAYDGINGSLVAQYDTAQGLYVVSHVREPDVTATNILNFSTINPFDTLFATITGAGSDLTDGPWPDWEQGQFRGFHVPFRLTPSIDTQNLIDDPIAVARPATQDLTFTWSYVSTGNDNFERVNVRVTGAQTELICSDIEGQDGNARIIVRVGALDEFNRREGGAAGSYQLRFERASFQAPLVIGDGELIDFSLRLRHSYLQTLRFQ